MILDELEGDAGVEEVRRNRMAQAVRGVVGVELGTGPVPAEEILDLALPERAGATGEERIDRVALGASEIPVEKLFRGGKERPLGPEAALDAFDDDPVPGEIDVAPAEEPDLAHAEAVVVDQGEKRPVPDIRDHAEEGSELRLRQVAGQVLVRREERHKGEISGVRVAARLSRRARWASGWSATI